MTAKVADQQYKYDSIDEIVWLNINDPELFPIPVNQLELLKRTYRQFRMPEPESWPSPELIEGYGLPRDKQKFTREITPQGLIELERTIRHNNKPKGKARDLSPVRRELTIINSFWEILEEQQEKYKEEIEWLGKMWYYRLFGKHLYINGKHTYLTGDNWWYNNYIYLNNGHIADYRDRDRRWYLGIKYCETTTETFANFNSETGLPMPEADGTYLMRDTLKRVCFGVNYPKMRREGFTSRLAARNIEKATRRQGGKVGIQAKDDDTATGVIFPEHYIQPFIKLPIFWKPIFDAAGGIAPKNTLLFDSLDDVGFGLHSQIDVATSSAKSKFDGMYLHDYQGDEFGKLERSDPNEIIAVIKFCLSTGGGSNIHGFAGVGSTVDEVTDESAGENYQKLCQKSQFDIRKDSGQTASGLFTLFFSSADGLEGFIDFYGESIIGDPTPEQARFIGKIYGAMEYLEGEIASYRRQKDWAGLAAFRRQYPIKYSDCFIKPPSQQILRRDLLEGQISFLQTHPELQAVRGDLYWKNGADSEVGWLPNAETGRFYLSRQFKPGETNQKIRRDNMWYPTTMDRFVASADTYGIDVTLGRKSNGSILVRWRRDVMIDPLDKDIELIESDRDVLTYSFRCDTVSEYCEDCILAAVYTGSMMYPERNKTNVIDHFIKRGYGGYLLYDHDRVTGKAKPSAGFWNKNELMDAAIRWLQEDLVKNHTRYYHLDLLQELLNFSGRNALTNLDLTVSKLGVLISERNPFYSMVKGHNNRVSVEGWIPGYDD